MQSKLIVITGYLASGKSTFASTLSERLRVPCFIKDRMKIALCESLGPISKAESSRFSAVTFDGMLYAAGQLLAVGQPAILEGNFVPAGLKKTDEAGEIRELAGRFGAETLTFFFRGDTRALHPRYLAREQTPERGEVNKMGREVPFEEFDRLCHNLDPFSIGGETVMVDTTDFTRVDFAALCEKAARFLGNPLPTGTELH